MTAIFYYRLAFALPVTLGFAAPWLLASFKVDFVIGIVSQIFSKGAGEHSLGMAVLELLLIPVALAFTPVSVGCLLFLRKRDEQAHRRLARWTPCLLGLSAASITTALYPNMDGAVILGLAAVMLGYAYLVVAAILLAVLRACSVIEPRRA